MSLRPYPLTPSTLTAQEAEQAGFWPLTTAYLMPSERWMLQNTLADLTKAGTAHVLVGDPSFPEVWRDGHRLHDSSNPQSLAINPRTRNYED